jgi:hypothetical protein
MQVTTITNNVVTKRIGHELEQFGSRTANQRNYNLRGLCGILCATMFHA